MYHADHDPISEVPVFECATCGAVSLPVDADWCSESLILVTYEAGHEAGCLVPSSWTVLVDPDSHDAVYLAPRNNAARAARQLARGRGGRGRRTDPAPASIPMPPPPPVRARKKCATCGVASIAKYCDECRCRGRRADGYRCAKKATQPRGYCGAHQGDIDEAFRAAMEGDRDR